MARHAHLLATWVVHTIRNSGEFSANSETHVDCSNRPPGSHGERRAKRRPSHLRSAAAPPVLVRGKLFANASGEVVAQAALQPVVTKRNPAKDGRMIDLFRLDDEAVTVEGNNFTVRLDPSLVPRTHRSRTGLVTLDLQFINLSTGQMSVQLNSAQIVKNQSGIQTWADPLTTDLSVMPRARIAVPRANRRETVPPVPPVRVDMGQGRLPRSMRTAPGIEQVRRADARGAVCGYTHRAATTNRWATVGTSYPLGRDTSTLHYGSSSKSTFGIGVNSGRGWDASGSRTIEDDWGQIFRRSSKARSYRVQVRYKLQTCWNSSGTTVTSIRWIPQFETGGTWAYALGSRPNYTRCIRVAAGEWIRGAQRGSDYSLSYGVKFRDKIGIDLRTQRAYSSSSKLVYHLRVGRRMCGSNDVPSRARTVRARSRS